jgi:uncharacterized protein (DUF433 family)
MLAEILGSLPGVPFELHMQSVLLRPRNPRGDMRRLRRIAGDRLLEAGERELAIQILPIESVVRDPEVRGGRPVIAGTTLRVSDLAAYRTLAGLTAEQLSAQFELDLARVHAGLAYYYDHKAEIDAEIRANAEQAEGWRQRLLAQGRAVVL